LHTDGTVTDKPKVLASFSRPQNTSSPTFQTPFSRTEDPVAFVATVCPSADKSYFTAALVEEVTDTEFTLEVRPLASGVDASELIADENCEPFWSSATRLLFGVEELKKVFQLVVISETALDEPPPAEGATDGADDADGLADEDWMSEADEPGVDEEELALLEQADTAVTSTRPSAGAR
jgi:hypothetical protein